MSRKAGRSKMRLMTDEDRKHVYVTMVADTSRVSTAEWELREALATLPEERTEVQRVLVDAYREASENLMVGRGTGEQ